MVGGQSMKFLVTIEVEEPLLREYSEEQDLSIPIEKIIEKEIGWIVGAYALDVVELIEE